MRHDKLFEPIDDAEPCGPDLDELGDDDYLNYMLPAEDRLPKRFFDQGNGAPFDRSTIDLKSELTSISRLLEKSRDLRLLALEARFQALAGNVVGFSESVQAMSGLVERYWNELHPRPYEGDYTMRQNTLSALDDRINIILPLQYAPLFRDKRLGPLSFHHYELAAGRAQPIPDEVVPELGALLGAFAQADNRDAVVAAHEALGTAKAGLSSIRNNFIDAAGYEYAPSFDGVREAIEAIMAMIETAVPDLAQAAAVNGGAFQMPEGGGSDAADAAAGAQPGAPMPAMSAASLTPDLSSATVRTHADASAALAAAEDYFLRMEPTAPALLLVHQARTLIGMPLIAAMELLMPESAERTVIRFEGPFKFQLDMARLRALSASAMGSSASANGAAGESYTASTRGEAADLISGVEGFFRLAEPSSPVPVLLSKARGFINRDFLAIVNDLIDKEEKAQ
jgi:type VI secretion system protein ImpA